LNHAITAQARGFFLNLLDGMAETVADISAIFFLAGPLAERKHCGRLADWRTGARLDLEQIKTRVCELSPQSQTAFCASFRKRALNLLAARDTEVVELAAALDRRCGGLATGKNFADDGRGSGADFAPISWVPGRPELGASSE
jgi:hypothetical protein